MDEEEVEWTTWDDLSSTDDPEQWAIAFAEFVAANQDAMSLKDMVNWFNHAMTTAKAIQWRDDSKELIGTQEMLGHVLRACGGQVVVNKNQLVEGHQKGAQILIEEDIQRDCFIFKLEGPSSE